MRGSKPISDIQITCIIEYSLMQILKYPTAASTVILRTGGNAVTLSL